MAFIQAGCLYLNGLGKASLITSEMESITIHPAMVATFSPTGVGVQVAKFVWYPIGFSI
jgi:hypothetical protein